jgi:hypothetical protein
VNVDLDLQATWIFKAEWLASLKAAVAKAFHDRRGVRVVLEDDMTADYVMKSDIEDGLVVLHVNYAERSTFEEMFQGAHLEAVLEHENRHIDTYNLMLINDTLPAPRLLRQTAGEAAFMQLTASFTHILRERLKDVCANCLMSPTSLRRYLEFELFKVRESWRERRGLYKVPLILMLAYIHTCGEMGGLSVPSQLSVLAAYFPKISYDGLIYGQAQKVFRAVWNAVKAKQQTVDVFKDTYELNELCYQQPEPVFQA